jgi:hypothetical protein
MSRRLLPIAAFLVGCSDYDINPKAPDNPGLYTDTGADGDTGDGPVEEDGDTGAVRGRVCDPSGDGWAVGALAYVDLDVNGDGTADRRLSDETDADGYFTITDLPLGAHTVVVEKGSFRASFDVVLNQGGLTELAEEECLEAEHLEVAVITGEYDHIGSILARMGVDFDAVDGVYSDDYIDFLTDPERMAGYDLIFLNCGIADGWLSRKEEIGGNLARFVEDGGSMYASDWAYYFFEVAFPSAVDFHGEDDMYGAAFLGDVGNIQAQVLDANMMAVLGGNRADLSYDLGAWVVPVSTLSTVQVMVQGDARLYIGGVQQSAPLAVKLQRGGTALFPTFHNEQQITLDMAALLEEIVLNL